MENFSFGAITTLPPELIQQICADKCISRDDLKSLRLVSRHFTGGATKLLFYRVCLSKLKTDRHAFLNVAARPHLAEAVRVLVWLELTDGDLGIGPHLFHLDNLTRNDRTLSSKDGDATEEIYLELIAQVRDALWTTTRYLLEPDSSIATVHTQTTAIEEFRPHLYAAIDAMNLHTIISQPMHPLRALTKSLTGYPLTAQVLISDTPNFAIPPTNDGFYSLLGFAMARSSSIKPITRLHLADEGHYSSITRLQGSFLPAFPHLTHIDLCISLVGNLSDLNHLTTCLHAAANLTHLRLCAERGKSYFDPVEEGEEYHTKDENEDEDSLDRRSMFDLLLCHPDAHWTRLQSLHLEDLWFSTVCFVRFAQRHASSLRCLRIDSCRLTAGLVLSLARITGLRLEQFIALPSVASDETVYISEARLLAFVNSNGTDIGLRESLYNNAPAYIRTHASVFDSEHCASGAICDSRGGDAFRRGYSLDEVHALDVENEDVRDGDNWTYERGGCWERPLEKGDLEIRHEHGEYAREHISHLKRWREAPRWMWGRADDGRGDVYYWLVDGDDGRWAGNLTEIWRFEHRNGKFAFGYDPLEFFEDWEGSEAGDISEPTPFGWTFRNYLLEQKSGQSDPNPWNPVPERAVKYHEDQDPIIGSMERPEDVYTRDANFVGPYEWCDSD